MFYGYFIGAAIEALELPFNLHRHSPDVLRVFHRENADAVKLKPS
ncbi:hypothetical protein [Chamaesiphon sp.]